MTEPIHDETFGRLTWDPLLECWLGGIDWPPGLHTEVAIRLPDDDLAVGLRRAREGLDWLRHNEEETRQLVAGKMLDVYNNAWRGEAGPVTEDEFTRRIELVRIGFEDDGSLLLSYHAGNMFGGHVIDGFFWADRSFRGANLVG
jgi:hypothetical protein